MMRAIKSKDSKPEMRVRRTLHAKGYRYRLHRRALPGTPDLVFPSKKKVIFVNGCFWHSHDCKNGRRSPKSNKEYWEPKIARNKERDDENIAALARLGWRSMTVWECETTDMKRTIARMIKFLG